MRDTESELLHEGEESAVVRTERGLVFAQCPRVSLYDVMDYLRAGYPPRLIADRFRLSERQIQAALDHIAAHREETDREYREVLDAASEQRRSWEARNHERLAQIASSPPPAEQRELRARLAAIAAREERLAEGTTDSPHETAADKHVSAT